MAGTAGHLPLSPIVPRQPPPVRDLRVVPDSPGAPPRPRSAVATGMAMLALTSVLMLASACGTSSASSASSAGGGDRGLPTPAQRSSEATAPDSGPAVAGQGTDGSATAAARAATAAFRTVIGNDAAGFVAAVGRLAADLAAGDLTQARVDELAAQSAYDGFRMLETGNTVIASTLDERATDLAPGQTFAGLHAVERDLWSRWRRAAPRPTP